MTRIDLSPEEVTNALQLNNLRDRLWYVVPSVATQGTGIFEGLVSFQILVSCSRSHSHPLGMVIKQRQIPAHEIIAA
jgi:hypothetical protein